MTTTQRAIRQDGITQENILSRLMKGEMVTEEPRIPAGVPRPSEVELQAGRIAVTCGYFCKIECKASSLYRGKVMILEPKERREVGYVDGNVLYDIDTGRLCEDSVLVGTLKADKIAVKRRASA